jgi:hypothetical protein
MQPGYTTTRASAPGTRRGRRCPQPYDEVIADDKRPPPPGSLSSSCTASLLAGEPTSPSPDDGSPNLLAACPSLLSSCGRAHLPKPRDLPVLLFGGLVGVGVDPPIGRAGGELEAWGETGGRRSWLGEAWKRGVRRWDSRRAGCRRTWGGHTVRRPPPLMLGRPGRRRLPEEDTLFSFFLFSFLIGLTSGPLVHVSKPNRFLPHQH